MAPTQQPELLNQSPKPRIVQYRNRRYSVRLEPIYWRALENLAKQQNQRLGRFVAELAEGHNGGNFSSYLRVYCMLEAERALASEYLGPTHGSLMDVVAACPSPGVILSRYRTIIGLNRAFEDWLGPTEVPVTGASLTTLIQVRTKGSLNDVWEGLTSGAETQAEARVLYVAPGRVNAAQAKFLALRSADGEQFYAVMWLLGAAARAAPKPQTETRMPKAENSIIG